MIKNNDSIMPLELDNYDNNKILSVVNADVHFKIGKKIIKACNNISFDIYRGEIFGIVGESGSGKTTITRAILGINKLTSGGIYFNGKLISRKFSSKKAKDIKRRIQMIFQDPSSSLNERANIEYIVSEGLYSFKLFNSNEDRINKVKNMLKNVGLSDEHLSRYPHEFSGGQRQRIGIARALIVEPELVLADEPISALDVSIRAQILNLLKKLQKEKQLTYLFIAHDLSIIRYLCDRIAVMHQGYIVETGYVEDIYNNPIHPYTKSLLSVIPIPNPKNRNILKTCKNEDLDADYSKWVLKDFDNNHYALIKEDEYENN